MKQTLIALAILVLAALPASAGSNGRVTGDYVEARTAEVFTGGCTMNSEAETVGRQAILAWRIDRGTFAGVPLDGLSIVAAVAGDRNLGIREMGGDAPTVVRAVMLVDHRATPAQQDALVALARELSRGLIDEVVRVEAAPIGFVRDAKSIRVTAPAIALAVTTDLGHDPSCGAMQWFTPLSAVNDAAIGMTAVQAFSGDALGTRWSDPGKKSAFFGTFAY